MEGKSSLGKLLLLTMAFTLLIGAASASAEPWKFGVMGDTQWTTTDPAGTNPNSVPASIIQEVNRQFINKGVKFVIQVGDLTDNGIDAAIAQRAAAAQPLIDAGIGFFPMRGNHETYASPSNNYAIPAFQKNFPQTQGGIFNPTNGPMYKLGKNFSSPTNISKDLAGMSYSFDYSDDDSTARFVIIDPWATPSKIDNNPDGYAYGYTIADQQNWISSRLDQKARGTQHAFVFSHQPVMAENHQDSPFSGYTNANPDMQNAFFASLDKNNADYYISGHDHIHQRSIIASPDGKSKIEELICASNSSKFYTPKSLTDSNWFGQKTRETSVSQERYTPGFYIFTVDGSCVTVDYYSDEHGNYASDNCYPDGSTPQSCTTPGSHITPIFNFVKKESWGYCQNGQEYLVSQGASYKTVQDAFGRTTAKILDGTNNSTATDYTIRKFIKTVNTGWRDMDDNNQNVRIASEVFTLSGMADVGIQQTDTYVLSLTYSAGAKDTVALVTKDKAGSWVNAVDMNFGGVKTFVPGAYNSSSHYALGTYGFDPSTRTVWAVINYNGNFAAAQLNK